MQTGTRVSFGGKLGTVESVQKIAYVGTLVYVLFDDGTAETINRWLLDVVEGN